MNALEAKAALDAAVLARLTDSEPAPTEAELREGVGA